MRREETLSSLVLHDVLREAERIDLLLEDHTNFDSIELAKKSLKHIKNIAYASLSTYKLVERKTSAPIQLDLEIEVLDSLRSLSLVFQDLLKKISISKDAVSTEIFLDPSYLKVILDNIFENAYRHGDDVIEIFLTTKNEKLTMTVSNKSHEDKSHSHGLGILLIREMSALLDIKVEIASTDSDWVVAVTF